MDDIITAVSETSSGVPILENVFTFIGDILQAGYDFVTGLVPETPGTDNGTEAPETGE